MPLICRVELFQEFMDEIVFQHETIKQFVVDKIIRCDVEETPLNEALAEVTFHAAAYCNPPGEHPGFMLMLQVACGRKGAGVDVGDTNARALVEAMAAFCKEQGLEFRPGRWAFD